MILDSVTIKNYRSIYDKKIKCDDLTILVGANGTGKSSFLKSLDLFYSTSLKIDTDDFYNGDIDSELSISVTLETIIEKIIF